MARQGSAARGLARRPLRVRHASTRSAFSPNPAAARARRLRSAQLGCAGSEPVSANARMGADPAACTEWTSRSVSEAENGKRYVQGKRRPPSRLQRAPLAERVGLRGPVRSDAHGPRRGRSCPGLRALHLRAPVRARGQRSVGGAGRPENRRRGAGGRGDDGARELQSWEGEPARHRWRRTKSGAGCGQSRGCSVYEKTHQ